MAVFDQTLCTDCSIRVYSDLFTLEWQHKTSIWEGLPCPLPFYITIFHFKHSFVAKYILLKYAPIMPAFCFLLMPSYIITTILPAKLAHRYPSYRA